MPRTLETWTARAEPVLTRVEPFLRPWMHRALWLLVIAPIAWMIAQAVFGQLGAEPIRMLELESGEWTLRLLACSLAVTPLIKLTRWGWLIPERRFLGLAAFFYAVGHMCVYVGLDWFFDFGMILDDIVKHLWVTAGLAALLLMLPLALTSRKSAIRKLGGKRWNQLHRLVYASAVAGCVHYLWSVKKDIEEPLMYSAVFAVLFLFRIYWWYSNPKRTVAAPTARAA